MIARILVALLAALLLVSVLLPTLRRLWVFQLHLWKYLLLRLAGWLRVAPRRDNAELLRRFCEDMGPTYIKFGQIIASSAGMFPRRWSQEFEKCLDRVRPFPFRQVQAILDEDLGPAAARLTELEPEPLASASVAQVHTAKLDGAEVVVKVQRPGISARVAADMRILRFAAQVAEGTVRDAELMNPVAVLEDFAATLREELDFQKESANLTEFARIMRALGYDDVRAPAPCPELTTRRVLVMERFRGTRVDDVARMTARGVDVEAKLIHGMKAWFQCVLFHGFFHGDVHAGNLMLLDDETIGFLDFGIVGRFTARQRAMVTDYIVAFVAGDYRTLAQVIVNMGGVNPGRIQLEAFATDLERAYKPLLAKSFGEIKYAEILPEIQRVASKHRMRMPREFVLITKQMLYFDRYAKLLAPRLNVFTDPRLVASMMADILAARASA
jgi:aarF domain-containing kinase